MPPTARTVCHWPPTRLHATSEREAASIRRNSAAVFTLSNTIPNTFGQFRTVTNPNPTAVIDTLSISLTNTMPASCCSPNQMGLDTIVLK